MKYIANPVEVDAEIIILCGCVCVRMVQCHSCYKTAKKSSPIEA
jgi:hypothetical protein